MKHYLIELCVFVLDKRCLGQNGFSLIKVLMCSKSVSSLNGASKGQKTKTAQMRFAQHFTSITQN